MPDTCRLCGDQFAAYADGYDGFCPSCADRLDAAGFWDIGDPERDDPAAFMRQHRQ